MTDRGIAFDAPALPTARTERLQTFPYWLVGVVGLLAWMGILIWTRPGYNKAFHWITPGLKTTLTATAAAFVIALVIGIVVGFGRISRNVVIRNVSQVYIEFVRGVPILPLLFTIAYVVVPQFTSAVGISNRSVTDFMRGCVGLALIYGAYLAEVFRGGIESIPNGQMEAGRSLGLSYRKTLRTIILPQAVRNMAPALGNDLIAMLKDSSLLSVLAVTEITQNARLYASSSFDYRSTYIVLTFLYASITLVLSLMLRWYRKRLGLDDD